MGADGVLYCFFLDSDVWDLNVIDSEGKTHLFAKAVMPITPYFNIDKDSTPYLYAFYTDIEIWGEYEWRMPLEASFKKIKKIKNSLYAYTHTNSPDQYLSGEVQAIDISSHTPKNTYKTDPQTSGRILLPNICL